MGRILRVLGILLLTVMFLLGAAWAVLVFTDLPARVATSGFNEGNPSLWLEARSANVHGDLLGVTFEGVSLAPRSKRDPVVRFERFDAALGALPSDEVVSVDHVDLEGLRVDLDTERLPALQELAARQATPPGEPSKPTPLVRLGRLRLRDASFAWRSQDDAMQADGVDLELKGVVGATGDLALTAAVATARAGQWTTEGVRLPGLTLSWQGLGGKLRVDRLASARLAGPGFGVTDATLSLEAEGGVAGVQLTKATFTARELSATLDGYARPTFGLGSRGLEVVLQGTLEADPTALLPGACPGVSRASGRFRVAGDPTRAGLTLASLSLTLTTPGGAREVSRADVPLVDGASLGALVAGLCAEAGAGAP